MSSQAICLQMAAAKEWGFENYAKLDPFTITRSHPEAATSVISKATEINSHYSVAPFYYYELATPGVHNVLKSYDTLGGPGDQWRHADDEEVPRRQSESHQRGLCRAVGGGGLHQQEAKRGGGNLHESRQ